MTSWKARSSHPRGGNRRWTVAVVENIRAGQRSGTGNCNDHVCQSIMGTVLRRLVLLALLVALAAACSDEEKSSVSTTTTTTASAKPTAAERGWVESVGEWEKTFGGELNANAIVDCPASLRAEAGPRPTARLAGLEDLGP